MPGLSDDGNPEVGRIGGRLFHLVRLGTLHLPRPASLPEGIRFDITHELGHLVMHSAGPTFEMSSKQEREADRFASEVLMPSTEVANYLPVVPSLEMIFEVEKHFRVSALAMTRKAFTLGRLSEWSHRQTVVELRKRGIPHR